MALYIASRLENRKQEKIVDNIRKTVGKIKEIVNAEHMLGIT